MLLQENRIFKPFRIGFRKIMSHLRLLSTIACPILYAYFGNFLSAFCDHRSYPQNSLQGSRKTESEEENRRKYWTLRHVLQTAFALLYIRLLRHSSPTELKAFKIPCFWKIGERLIKEKNAFSGKLLLKCRTVITSPPLTFEVFLPLTR